MDGSIRRNGKSWRARSRLNGSCRTRILAMLTALVSGIVLGLSSGLAPGPLLGLVIAQTLRYGAREGCKIALTPLATDAPIVVLTLLLAARLASFQKAFGAIAILGGGYVLYLAWDTAHPGSIDLKSAPGRANSWIKGILTNLLNPHPWMFWCTVGSVLLAKAMAKSGLTALAFLFGFYLLLVGSKVAVALMAARSRDLLAGPRYRIAMRALSFLLVVLALLLIRQGIVNLELVPAGAVQGILVPHFRVR